MWPPVVVLGSVTWRAEEVCHAIGTSQLALLRTQIGRREIPFRLVSGAWRAKIVAFDDHPQRRGNRQRHGHARALGPATRAGRWQPVAGLRSPPACRLPRRVVGSRVLGTAGDIITARAGSLLPAPGQRGRKQRGEQGEFCGVRTHKSCEMPAIREIKVPTTESRHSGWGCQSKMQDRGRIPIDEIRQRRADRQAPPGPILTCPVPGLCPAPATARAALASWSGCCAGQQSKRDGKHDRRGILTIARQWDRSVASRRRLTWSRGCRAASPDRASSTRDSAWAEIELSAPRGRQPSALRETAWREPRQRVFVAESNERSRFAVPTPSPSARKLRAKNARCQDGGRRCAAPVHGTQAVLARLRRFAGLQRRQSRLLTKHHLTRPLERLP